jgi:hypothetical protein
VAPSLTADAIAPARVPFEFDGNLGIFVCVPMGSDGCTGLALVSTEAVADLPAGNLTHVELNATWTARTPGSQTLFFQLYCTDAAEGSCPGDPVVISGVSPLHLSWTVTIPDSQEVLLVVTTINLGEATGGYGQVRDGTTFNVSGELGYH